MAGLIPVRAVPLLSTLILGTAGGYAVLTFFARWLLPARLSILARPARLDCCVKTNDLSNTNTPHAADSTLDVNGRCCVA